MALPVGWQGVQLELWLLKNPEQEGDVFSIWEAEVQRLQNLVDAAQTIMRTQTTPFTPWAKSGQTMADIDANLLAWQGLLQDTRRLRASDRQLDLFQRHLARVERARQRELAELNFSPTPSADACRK